MTTTANTIAREMSEGLAEAARQVAFLDSAGPDDVAAILAIMERAVDDGDDPRIMAGLACLRRLLVPVRG